ncbi:hypothetical protein [Bacillus sp. T33-2]|uniref:hypothetical protein n=1 Tax=Bacillus sp. T33-2 TaxID=2054168 RepID=UPI000C7689F4|nr:hypothetical protein [Bacillus sp. T33-2]PLR94800.1 hypothetical protein CVD19_16130 [Bacillus sp. T33-2]
MKKRKNKNLGSDNHVKFKINDHVISGDKIPSEKIQTIFNHLQPTLETIMSTIDKDVKNINVRFDHDANSLTKQIESLIPMVEPIVKDGRLKVKLNDEIIVDVQLPESAKDAQSLSDLKKNEINPK